jgi:hypothetical protein
MAVTVTVGDNPTRNTAGTARGDAVTINSGFVTGNVEYMVRRRDQVPYADGSVTISRSTALTTQTAGPTGGPNEPAWPQVISRSVSSAVIILPFRTNFQARCRRDAGWWTPWVDFKTRDKRYQSPDAITQLSDDAWLNAATQGSFTINVTNNAKATEVITAAGSTVTNSDTGYVGTTNIAATAAGATVTNSDPYQAPNGNITITV